MIDVPGGQIVMTCDGNSIVNANATVSDPSYIMTVKSITDPAVDVFFAKS